MYGYDKESMIILMAEDDEDDRLLTRDAMIEGRITNEIRFVEDGQELVDYLLYRGNYTDPESAPRPALILLDLNMPRLDGREALTIIKQHRDLRRIPIVVLTTSKAEEDIIKSYDVGANAFITKPVTFEGLVNVLRAIGHYWLEIVKLPIQ